MPFNLDSLRMLFPQSRADQLEQSLIEKYGLNARVPILKLRESADSQLRSLADYVFEKFFLGYTIKQWGVGPDELDPSVTGRVPVSISRDDRYFQDTYQAMPGSGYAALFRNMLAHPNISLLLNTDYREIDTEVHFDRMIYTGQLDEFFDFAHGSLRYRSLRFESETLDSEWGLDAATVNYPNEYDFTRVIEWKRLTAQRSPRTTLMTEYPTPHHVGENIPYYPIPGAQSASIVARYQEEAGKLGPRVLFAGRLADYKYYNMDQAVERAMGLFEEVGKCPIPT